MSEVFETDEHAYRACILYEVLHKKTLKEAYEKIKTVKPNIDYSEFEYWYFRFSNGRYDLKHDRNTDKTLSDMPTNVMERIVNNLGLVDKLSARKVCRKLRTVIDDQRSELGDGDLDITEKSCKICYEHRKIKYSAQENGDCLLTAPRKSILLKGDYSMMAMKEFASVITHPKWSFKELSIFANCDPENDRKSIIFLNALLSNHQIHVEKLIITARTYEPMATLLPHFKPDRLVFDLDSPLDDTQENLFEVIGQTEQWKNATNIIIDILSNKFPIEFLFSARGEIEIYDFKLTESRLVKIRDMLFKAPAFEHFKFYDEKYDNREKLSVLTDRVMGAHSAYDPHTKVYRIENSKDYIQFSFAIIQGEQVLTIERIHS